jgi:hypothetical protein
MFFSFALVPLLCSAKMFFDIQLPCAVQQKPGIGKKCIPAGFINTGDGNVYTGSAVRNINRKGKQTIIRQALITIEEFPCGNKYQ